MASTTILPCISDQSNGRFLRMTPGSHVTETENWPESTS